MTDNIDKDTARRPVVGLSLEVCSTESCGMIKVPGTEIWIGSEADNYQDLKTQYEGKFNHGLCDPCLQIQRDQMKAYKLTKLKNSNG